MSESIRCNLNSPEGESEWLLLLKTIEEQEEERIRKEKWEKEIEEGMTEKDKKDEHEQPYYWQRGKELLAPVHERVSNITWS